MNRPRNPKYSDHIKTLLYSCQTENVQLAIILGKAVNLQFYKMLLQEGWFKFKVSHPEHFTRLNQTNALVRMSLEDADMQVFSQLLGLENNIYLSLNNNQLARTDFLARWSNLEVLLLEDNKITNLEGLQYLPKLKELYLDNNQLTDLSPLAKCPNLEILRLSHNKIANLEWVQHLPKLRGLYLDNNQLTDASLIPLVGHPCLERLYLHHNRQLQNFNPLVGIPTLKYLDICHTSKHTNVQYLLKMPQLECIDRYPEKSIRLSPKK